MIKGPNFRLGNRKIKIFWRIKEIAYVKFYDQRLDGQ